MELNATEIVYKKWGDLNGSNYIMDSSLASAISYENGRKEDLSEIRSQYAPGNQSYGTQQYNDRALLALDYSMSHSSKHYKGKEIVNMLTISGCVLGAAGLITGFAIIGTDDGYDETPGFLAAIGCGVVAASTCFIIAHHIKKKGKMQTYSLYNYDFSFPNGSSLAVGIDLIRDKSLGQNTPGLGLRYNF